MKKKTIALVLAMVLCLGLFAGCQSSELRSYSDETQETEETAAGTETAVKDYAPVYATYKPDQLMLTVNGIDITWSELFYWYYNIVSQIDAYAGGITDWDAASLFDNSQTYREYVVNSTLETIKSYCSIESKAKEMGVSLSADDQAQLDAVWQSNVDSYGQGDEAKFIEYLEGVFLTKEVYDHINSVNMLYTALMREMFGEKGEKLTEEEVLEDAADEGYYRTKHLLLKTVDDSDSQNKIPLADDVIAEKKAAAETLLAELQGITDPAALEARFDEMMAEHGEDTGMAIYTDGYTKLPDGSFVAEYETAAQELGENEVSGIVESSYGYHIILRLPLKATAVVEFGSTAEEAYTLAFMVANERFSALAEGWMNDAKVEPSKDYEEMDIAKVFANVKTVEAKTEE